MHVKEGKCYSLWPNIGVHQGGILAKANDDEHCYVADENTCYTGKWEFVFFWGGLFVFVHSCSIWKFSGQGMNLSSSCDLHSSWGSARSFNPLHLVGDQTRATTSTQAIAV